jgi:hypothetical protein
MTWKSDVDEADNYCLVLRREVTEFSAWRDAEFSEQKSCLKMEAKLSFQNRVNFPNSTRYFFFPVVRRE